MDTLSTLSADAAHVIPWALIGKVLVAVLSVLV